MRRGDLDEFGKPALWVSWSRLYEWNKCQQKSVLRLQGKGDTIKDGRRFLHGTLADRAVRRWLEQPTEHLPGQMASYVDDLWEEHAIKSPEYKIYWKGDPKEDMARVRNLAKKVVTNVEPFLIKRVLPFEYQAEWRFDIPVKVPTKTNEQRTIVLNGGADIVVRDGEHVWLYDLKATENENYVHQGIMPQLIFYSIAWSLLFGTPAEEISAAFLTPACKLQYHPLDITSQDRRHLMTRIVDFAQFHWDDVVPKLTDDINECYFCGCKKSCPRFAVATSGNNVVSIGATIAQRKLAKDNEK